MIRRPPAPWSAGALALMLLVVLAFPASLDAASLHEVAASLARGRLAEAEAAAARATVQRPADPRAWLWLGVVRFHRGEYGRAERALARAAALAPHDGAVLVWWGHVLVRAGRGPEAASVFRQALVAGGSAPVRQMAQQALRTLGPLPPSVETHLTAMAVGSRSGGSWVLNVDSYRKIARSYNVRLTAEEADLIARALLGYSREFNLDPRLVVALVVVESGFQPLARSHAGAMGLGQLMPGTARSLGVNPWDPAQNLYGSIRYLRGNLDRFGWHNAHLALAAYNAGRGAVERYAGIPPYAETQWYVANVTKLYRRLLVSPGEMR